MRYPAGNVVDAGAEGGVGGGHVAAMKQELGFAVGVWDCRAGERAELG